jgi:hypothetical protein
MGARDRIHVDGVAVSKTDGGFLPDDYMDEIVPPTRQSPDAWVTRLDDGAYALDADSDMSGPTLLSEGQIVKFCRLTNYGNAILTIGEDAHTVEPPMPAEAENVMVLFDPDTLSPGVRELVENLRESPHDLSESFELIYYTWSTGEDYRFDQASGKFTAI